MGLIPEYKELPLPITKNSRSFCHEKTAKTHSFAKRGRAKAQECRELATLAEIKLSINNYKYL
jgi:hypothetical protein